MALEHNTTLCISSDVRVHGGARSGREEESRKPTNDAVSSVEDRLPEERMSPGCFSRGYLENSSLRKKTIA